MRSFYFPKRLKMPIEKDKAEIEERETALQEIIEEVKKKFDGNNQNPISVELIGRIFKISSYADILKLRVELRHFLKLG
jgi:hypothetical protein